MVGGMLRKSDKPSIIIIIKYLITLAPNIVGCGQINCAVKCSVRLTVLTGSEF